MFKNTASQKWVVFAFEDEGGTNPGEPVTGDAANITANVRIDGAAANAVDDVNPTELEDGYYIFDITAAESNGDSIVITPASATANVNVIGVPGAVYTRTDLSGVEAKVDTAQSDLDIITDTDGVIVGAAGIDLVWDETLTAGSHNVVNSAGRRLRSIQDGGSTYGGFIWIDTVNGTAGTTAYENGTSDNPVASIADANTLAAAVNIPRFQIAPGSSLTLAATQANQAFFGTNWILALGGQNIAGSFFQGATISGIGTGSEYHFTNCHIGTATLADGDLDGCSLDDTLTLSAAASYRLEHCFSGIAGSGSPTIDFGAVVGNTALNMRSYSGGVTINNKDGTGTDTMSLEGNGQLVVAASSSGSISVRGNFRVTNTGGATITYDDNTANVAAILVDSNELQTDWTNGGRLDLIVDAILADTNELQVDWVDGGRLDLLLDGAASAGDPWTTALPGAYGAGTAGKIIGDNINAPLDTIDTVVDAILDDTGTSGVVISATVANEIADALLKRDWTAVSGEAARSALNALRLLRNKYSIAGTTLTVTEEDDTTSAWTSTLTTDAAADPVTASDPA